jgi:hypothetical protein
MKMVLSIAALVAANTLLPLLLAVCAVARAVASIIIHASMLTVTPAKAGAPLYRGQKSGVPASAGMTRSNWVIERGLHERKGKRPLFFPFFFHDGMGVTHSLLEVDGDIRKIEYVDRTIDPKTVGGIYEAGDLNLGRVIKPDNIPTKFEWGGPNGGNLDGQR